jgi:hypothetical protein
MGASQSVPIDPINVGRGGLPPSQTGGGKNKRKTRRRKTKHRK